MKNLKKWKIIRIVTTSIICIFLLFCICKAITIHNMNTKYPYETLGAIMINNWVESFFLEMTFILYVLGIPLIVDIIFLIISTIKIKKLRK